MNRKTIFVFEWFTGGGLKDRFSETRETGADTRAALQREGLAMLKALVSDILQVEGWDVYLLLEKEFEHEFVSGLDSDSINIKVNCHNDGGSLASQMKRVSDATDRTILIAPETQGSLANCFDWIGDARVYGSRKLVDLTSDKAVTADFFERHAIPRIPQREVKSASDFGAADPFPMVVKPRDGAGSHNVFYVNDVKQLDNIPWTEGSWIVQPFIPGVPASVCVVGVGDGKFVVFPAMRQVFDKKPIGNFVLGEDSLSDDQLLRARRLADQVVAAMPFANGIFGIDMILADNNLKVETSAPDVVVEINPRMVSSYGFAEIELRKQAITRLMNVNGN